MFGVHCSKKLTHAPERRKVELALALIARVSDPIPVK